MAPLFTGLAAAVVLALATTPAQAAQTRIQYIAGPALLKSIVTVIDPVDPGTDSFARTSPLGGTSFSEVAAWASFGSLKARAESSAQGRDARNEGFAKAELSDTITVSNDALAGQAGWVRLTLAYDFSVGVAGSSANAEAVMRMIWNGATAEAIEVHGINNCQPLHGCSLFDRQTATYGGSGITSRTFAFGSAMTFDVPIVFGRADDLLLELTTGASTGIGQTGEPSQANSDAYHSVYWGGIQAVLDGSGNVVQAGISSQSGTDYRRSFIPTPVPEPATTALWLGGLALVGWRLRRRAA